MLIKQTLQLVNGEPLPLERAKSPIVASLEQTKSKLPLQSASCLDALVQVRALLIAVLAVRLGVEARAFASQADLFRPRDTDTIRGCVGETVGGASSNLEGSNWKAKQLAGQLVSWPAN